MSPALPARLLLLDCDGVLIRSEAANLAYYNHLFEAFGLARVEQDDRVRTNLLHTLSTPQVIDAFFPPERIPEARRAAETLDFSLFVPLLEAEPGWAEVLPRLRATFSVAVATNRGGSARAVLGAVGLLPHVDAVLTIRDVRRPKPHPDLLLAALERFGATSEAALYVGDSDLDRRAADAAAVAFLGFRTEEGPSASSAWEVEEYLRGFAARPLSASMAPAVGTEDPSIERRRR